jgi:putative hydrolase of the HAD superfamily
MNGTFLFGGDRFGPDQDYAATYRTLGGRRLAPDVVREAVTGCIDTLGPIYDDSAQCDSFPSVRATLRALPAARDLPDDELTLIERVIAHHEVGRVPDPYAQGLQRLARTHQLGVVANVLSQKDPWLKEFARASVLDLLKVAVFSSDSSSIKPSRRLFDQAVGGLGVPRSDIVFVGDSLRCDIGGAAGAGLATVWIDRRRTGLPPGGPRPDWIVRDLLELV